MKAVTLIKPHTHAGTEYPAGATITVAAGTADYLQQHGIAALVRRYALQCVSTAISPKENIRKNNGGTKK